MVTEMPSDSPPNRYRGAIHARNGSRRGIATTQEERILYEKRRSLDTSFDVLPVYTADINALNKRQFEEEYLPKAFHPKILAENDRNLNERLAATKMILSIDKTTPTFLGVLTLGKNPRGHLPNSWIQFLRINGTNLFDDIIDADEISSDLTTMLKRVDDKLKAHNFTRVDSSSFDIERRFSSYPLFALQQLTRNAIMHRTYEGTNAPVRITWFNDRIEITSPGGPFGNVTKDNFGQAHVTDYRNPNLSEALKVLGFVQRFGVGIASARKELHDNGHPDLEFNISDTFVVAIIKGRQS